MEWNLNIRRKALVVAAALAAVVAPLAACADHYPSKPVTVVVAYPPGGSTDMLTRLIASNLEKKLGQPFIVVNKPGAAGNIGTAWAARAAPDGYTLTHSYVGTISINPTLYKTKLPYEPKDLVGISPFASIPLFLVTPVGSGVHSVAQLIAKAKANPGALTYGTVGIGSPSHVFAEMFKVSAGIKVLGIPFNGSAPAVNALLGGHVDFMFTAGQVLQQVKAGRLNALATTDSKRSADLPDLPTVGETLPGYEAVSWHGIFAPAGTPKPIIDLLNAKITEILAQPDVQKVIAGEHMNVMSMSPSAFADFIRQDTVKWTEVINSNNIHIE